MVAAVISFHSYKILPCSIMNLVSDKASNSLIYHSIVLPGSHFIVSLVPEISVLTNIMRISYRLTAVAVSPLPAAGFLSG